MGKEWHTIASREVGSDRKIRIPDEVREVVEMAGTFVCWNYEKHSKYVVISNEPLEKENYEYVDSRRILARNTYPKIRPPIETTKDKPEFPDDILSNFYEGNELFYLIFEEMARDNDIGASFLLTQKQVIELLPEEVPKDDGDLKKSILNTPGFLPSPR